MIHFLLMALFAIPMMGSDTTETRLENHEKDFIEKMNNPRLAKTNFFLRRKIENELKKDLQSKFLIETDGVLENKDPSKFLKEVNNIHGDTMLKQTKLQNARLKQQARTSYKEVKAHLKKTRAEIVAEHGFGSKEDKKILDAQRSLRKSAEAAGVTGLGYQISKMTRSNKVKPIIKK